MQKLEGNAVCCAGLRPQPHNPYPPIICIGIAHNPSHLLWQLLHGNRCIVSCAGLSQVMMTGGMAPGIGAKCAAEDAYRRLFRRVITQVSRFCMEV